MGTGMGAAFGVDLYTEAQVKLTDEPGVIKAKITCDLSEKTVLAEKTAMRVLQLFQEEEKHGAEIKTSSNIPIAKGLKSSSVAANAIALATVAALGKTLDDLEIVKLGVEAAFDAKATITGAFDDACASYFGGIVVTDNLKRKIIKQSAFEEDLAILFLVPPQKAYSADADVERVKSLKPLVQVAFDEALVGRFCEALTLNGLVYSSAWGYDNSIAVDAMAAGALAAGLCGKGPAVTAIATRENADSVKAALQNHGGEILQAHLNKEKAKVTKQWLT